MVAPVNCAFPDCGHSFIPTTAETPSGNCCPRCGRALLLPTDPGEAVTLDQPLPAPATRAVLDEPLDKGASVARPSLAPNAGQAVTLDQAIPTPAAPSTLDETLVKPGSALPPLASGSS